jgi:hypothetical protein
MPARRSHVAGRRNASFASRTGLVGPKRRVFGLNRDAERRRTTLFLVKDALLVVVDLVPFAKTLLLLARDEVLSRRMFIPAPRDCTRETRNRVPDGGNVLLRAAMVLLGPKDVLDGRRNVADGRRSTALGRSTASLARSMCHLPRARRVLGRRTSRLARRSRVLARRTCRSRRRSGLLAPKAMPQSGRALVTHRSVRYGDRASDVA